MAVVNFDELEQFTTNNDNKINFLKLQDDGWYANVRFMYGPGESFQGFSVHNVSQDPTRPKYVPCLRGLNQPLDVCPLCKNGSKVNVQFYIPVYVVSIVTVVNGVQQEQPMNSVMLFQRGTTFKGCIQSVLRSTSATGKPIVSSLFRLVRSGKAGDKGTQYIVEYAGTDETTLEQLPERPQILGSYILPDLDYNAMMEKYVNPQPAAATPANVPSGIQPRTINANTFAGNTVVGGGFPQTAAPQPQMMQAPNQAPVIPSTNVPF